MLNGMRCDYSWSHPGQDYLNIYKYIRHKRPNDMRRRRDGCREGRSR